MLDRLKASSKTDLAGGYSEEYDLLVVGGGATGSGVAVDAASRGLKVALVERDDFSSGECPSQNAEVFELSFGLRENISWVPT